MRLVGIRPRAFDDGRTGPGWSSSEAKREGDLELERNARVLFAAVPRTPGRTAAGREALVASPGGRCRSSPSRRAVSSTRAATAPLSGRLPSGRLLVRPYTLTGTLQHSLGRPGDLAERDGRQPCRPGIPGALRAGCPAPDRVDSQLRREHRRRKRRAGVPLSATGGISVVFGVSGGDLILDTNGYFAPLGVVNSLNGQGGDLTLAPGRQRHAHAGSAAR